MHIRDKIIIFTLPVVLFAFAIFTSICLYLFKSHITDLVYSDLDDVATSQQYLIMQVMKDNEEKYKILTKNINLINAINSYLKIPSTKSQNAINEILNYQANEIKDIKVYNVVGLNGKIIASNIPENIATDYDDFPISQVKSKDIVNLFSIEDNKVVRSVAGPIFYDDQRMATAIAVLDLNLSADYIAEGFLFVRPGLLDTGETILIRPSADQEGYDLIRAAKLTNNTAQLNASQVSLSDITMPSITPTTGNANNKQIILNAQQCFAVFKTIPNVDWMIISLIAKSEAYSDLYRLQWYIFWSLMFILVFYSLSLMLISKTITKPLVTLTNVMLKYKEHGTLDDYKVQGSQEIVLLSNVLKETVSQLQFQVEHDILTGIINRHYFTRALNAAIETAKVKPDSKFAVYFIMASGIQDVNETLGHDYGDRLLCEIAKRFGQFKFENLIFARFDGDQFVALVNRYTSEDALAATAGIMINMFIQPFSLENQLFKIDINIGISKYPDDASNANDLLQFADNAMVDAKKTAVNSYKFYDKDLGDKLQHSQWLRNELVKAITEKTLQMYYQPQIDVISNKIVGLEALLRWQHPTAGFISPVEFIELAEKNNLMNRVTDLALENTYREFHTLREAGISIDKMSINLSIQDFERGDLVKALMIQGQHYSIPAHHIMLEITESLFMSNITWVVSIISQLKSLGYMIALDDFGKGFSSLNVINHLPIDLIKIDKAFVDDLFTEINSKNVVLTIIDLAKHMNKKLLSEGVETVEQVNWLREHGCHLFQGYYFSKPLPLNELIEFYKNFNQPDSSI